MAGNSVRKLRTLVLLLLGVTWLMGCERAYLRIEGSTMGTYYRVTALCPEVPAAAVGDQLAAELARVNEQMSTYLPQSELMRFNSAPVGEWFVVSDDLLSVLDAARQIHARSGGAFDVTLAALVDLWGFGPGGRVSERPEQPEVDRLLEALGQQHLELDATAGSVRRLTPLTVDLSAIAKGHGVDRLSELLAAQGCTDHLVDIGGEVRAQGLNPDGRLWRVGVEVPDPTEMGSIARVLILDAVAVATSGDYRNFLELGGERFSHTLDPRTGYPVDHDLASVTVVHPSAMWADGLATALIVLGPDAGFALAEGEGLAALFLVRRPNGFEERYTSAMLNHLAQPPEK